MKILGECTVTRALVQEVRQKKFHQYLPVEECSSTVLVGLHHQRMTCLILFLSKLNGQIDAKTNKNDYMKGT